MQRTKDQDYRIKGYHKVMSQNNTGDAHVIDYFADYNDGDPLNLKVRETRTYTRNGVTGIVEEINIKIDWFSGDGITIRDTKTIIKHIDIDRGMRKNERARKRLLNKAKGAAIQMIGMSAGKTFMRNFANEMTLYIEGDREPLIDGINNSGQTDLFKNTLTGVLDVSY